MIKKLLNSNVLWSLIAVIINCAINFLVIPYVTENVGLEAYGFVSLANTMVTYIDVISIAFNAFASRYIAIEYHRGDLKKANQYYSSIYIANLLLCFSLICACLPLIIKLEYILNISPALRAEVKMLFCIVLLRYFFVLLRNAFDVSTFICGRIDITEKLRAISYIIQAITLLVTCTWLQASIRYVGMASAVSAFFLLIAQYVCKCRLTPELKVRKCDFSATCIKHFLNSGIWNSINNMGNLLNNGLDLLISNKLLSELLVGMISVSKTVGSLCYTLVIAVSNSFRPNQLKAYSVNNISGLVEELKKSMRITGSFCAVMIAGFAVCGMPFLRLWIPDQDHLQIYRLTFIVLLGDVIIGVVNPLYYVFTLTKRLKLPCIITIAIGVLNIVGKLALIHFTDMDVYAVVIMTTVVNFVHFFDTPLYASHCLRISKKTFYPVILRHLLNCGLVFIAMNGLELLLPEAYSWMTLLLKIAIHGIVGGIISAVVMFSDKIITFIHKH